jgi:hypothetical protein
VRIPGDVEYLIEYEELIGKKKGGISEFFHGLSGRVFKVNELLGEVEATDGYISHDGSDRLGPHVGPPRSGANAFERPFCFAAYASEDRPFVDRLTERLRMVGVEVWYDVRIRGGTQIGPEIEKRILDSAAMLLIVTPESHRSSYVRNEVAIASNSGKPIIPIQLRLVENWVEIASPKWIFATDEATMIKEIYRSVEAYL